MSELTDARRPLSDSDVRVPDFDAVYGADADPWEVDSSWYERRKLGVLLASLPRERYASAWEPGCGPGITTTALAGRASRLFATDSSQIAVDLARERCGALPQVSVQRSTVPDVPLHSPVELVVVAEFLYYVEDLQAAVDALWSVAVPGTQVAFLHWAHRPDDAFRSGPEMHARIAIDAVEREAVRVVTHSDEHFMLDIYEATS